MNIKHFIDTIQCGDAKILLRQFPSESIDMTITSPPYYKQREYNGIGTGNESSVDLYINSLLDVFEEVLRVTKPSGNIVYNLGDKYIDSSLLLIPYQFALAACNKYPIRLVNDVTWVKKNPTPRQFNRRLVSSTEPFFHFVKCEQYYYDRKAFLDNEENNPKKHVPTNKLGMSYRKKIDTSDLSEEQKKSAHVALDKVIQDVKLGKIQGFRMKIDGIHAPAFGGQEGGRKTQMEKQGFTVIRINGERMKRDVIESPVESIQGIDHRAVFPLSVIREFIKMLTPKGGIILDPYIGSGTTALAAIAEKCRYIGIDIDSLYCQLSEKRIQTWKRQKSLF